LDSRRTDERPREIVLEEADIPSRGAKLVAVGGGISVGVFRSDGSYYAFLNRCPHQQGPVCEGGVTGAVVADATTGWKPAWVMEGGVLLCPWHGLEFDLETGACFSRKELRLRRFEVRAEGGRVRIQL
jgi:nitrite reductase (NADH) small subunit